MKNICFFTGCYLILLYSCEPCDPSINLGDLPLTETSKSYAPYTGDDTLVFLDELGIENKFTSLNGWDSTEYHMIVRTLCNNWPASPQNEYYDIQNMELLYTDSSGKKINIGIHTNADYTSNFDSIAIYDWFEVTFSKSQQDYAFISIITEERQSKVSNNIWDGGYHSNQFIGDTTLYGKEFKDVYTNVNNADLGLFYNKEKGVVAINFSADKYWVLKE